MDFLTVALAAFVGVFLFPLLLMGLAIVFVAAWAAWAMPADDALDRAARRAEADRMGAEAKAEAARRLSVVPTPVREFRRREAVPGVYGPNGRGGAA